MRRDGGTGPAAPATSMSDIGISGGEPEPPTYTGMPLPAVDNRLFVLVLQHPQERSELRATAAATVEILRRARLAVGLSWPNLTRALGTGRPADPRHWGVLYLGSAQPRSLTWGSRPRESPRPALSQPSDPARRDGGTINRGTDRGAIIALDRDGSPRSGADRTLRGLDGIVLLDGTWSQAKTLWWRNPWLLKLHRFVLNPPEPARLGRLRREPRPEALSTLEAAALVLRHVEPDPKAADMLLAALDRLIAAHGGAGWGGGDRGAIARDGIDRDAVDRDAGDAGTTGRGPDDSPDRWNFSPRTRYARRRPHHRGKSAAG